MNIVLDTNIFVRDFLMNSVSFRLLFDFLQKTNSRILMPQIVYQELGEVYRRELNKRLVRYRQARKSVEKVLIDAHIPPLETDVLDEEVDKYLEFVRKKLNIQERDIVPFKENYLGELVTRAIRRLKPFSNKGEEFRDALLWLTVLDIARETKGETLAFISGDAKAFGQNNQLYEVLLNEAEAIGRQVNYCNTIGEFIKSHAVQVEHITQDWLSSAINIETFEEAIAKRLCKFLEQLDEYDLKKRGWEGLEFTGHLNSSSEVTEDNLTEYYVHELSDGSLYVEANYYIEYEIEFNFREKVKVEDELFGYRRRAYDYDDYYDLYDFEDELIYETKTKYKYREAEIIFGVSVEDQQVTNIELSSWHL